MMNWNRYRLRQNKQSLEKLLLLLSKLDSSGPADDKAYEDDVDDLQSLKIIYETGIRSFESQIEKHQRLIGEQQ